MAMFVMAPFGMGLAGAEAGEPAHMMHHEAQSGSDCQTMDDTGAPVQKGHAACTITVCCFSEAPDFGAVRPDAQVLPCTHAVSVEARLTQVEPEHDKKPPKHT